MNFMIRTPLYSYTCLACGSNELFFHKQNWGVYAIFLHIQTMSTDTSYVKCLKQIIRLLN